MKRQERVSDPSVPVARPSKVAKGGTNGADTRTQAEKFEAAARELGCDPDEDQFKGVLRKLAKPKT